MVHQKPETGFLTPLSVSHEHGNVLEDLNYRGPSGENKSLNRRAFEPLVETVLGGRSPVWASSDRKCENIWLISSASFSILAQAPSTSMNGFLVMLA